ncbi:COX15/CtaA family protein [Ferdinandcohnia sp. SAFN-114]|uniref:COX15/CtaA family protein n=1 Tax=Ferdinandcohnia sp. SAFN-114 TaxID=3387275 RepID=UPI003F7FC607
MGIRGLSILSILVAYFLIVFGGYVASSQSGMGCGPDWPLCNGVLIPVLEGETLIEYAHRVIGALLFVLSAILFLKVKRTETENHVKTTANWMMLLLILQVILGAIVVLLDLPAIVVTIHLLIAMAYFACLLFIWKCQTSSTVSVSNASPLKKHYFILILLLTFTLGFGAYIKHQSYGLACEWLSCSNSFLPLNKAQILQSLHRFFAYASAIYILILTFFAFTKNWSTSIRLRLVLTSLTVLSQIIAGIFTIKTALSIPWAVIHLAIGTALFGIIVESCVTLHFSHTSIKVTNWRSTKFTK